MPDTRPPSPPTRSPRRRHNVKPGVAPRPTTEAGFHIRCQIEGSHAQLLASHALPGEPVTASLRRVLDLSVTAVTATAAAAAATEERRLLVVNQTALTDAMVRLVNDQRVIAADVRALSNDVRSIAAHIGGLHGAILTAMTTISDTMTALDDALTALHEHNSAQATLPARRRTAVSD
jgi:transposase